MIKIKAGILGEGINWIRGAVSEVTQIQWPNKREIFIYFIAVLILSVIITAYIYGLDKLFIALQAKLMGIN